MSILLSINTHKSISVDKFLRAENTVQIPKIWYTLLYCRMFIKYASIAQSVEHLPFKQRVVGSNPTGGTKIKTA